jgi:hypothetical protein
MFELEKALAQVTLNLSQRKSKNVNNYVLYAVRSNGHYDKSNGSTIKQLIAEFREGGNAYDKAFIFRVGEEDKVLRYFDRTLSKKFFSMTRKGTK